MRHRRVLGGALASTLIVVLFLTVFGLTLANLSVFDLTTSSRNNQKEIAFNAAETGLETVIGELTLDPTIGNSTETFQQTLPDGSRYTVTFDSAASLPHSVNNLDNLSGRPGYGGRTVPPLHALLFARGVSPRGEESIIECLIRLEALPYAVAATGKVSLNTAIINGKRRATDSGAPTLTGSVYSGAPGPGSTQLLGLTQVSGDARSVGGINNFLGNVAGKTEPYHSAESLPDLQITDFRNDTTPGVALLPGGLTISLALSGQVYFNSDTTLTGVTLLNDVTVFVNGDLTVLGSVIGNGTFFVNGETTFLTAITMAGTNRVTLFSQGDINFVVACIFQGVLYTHGNVNTGPLLSSIVTGAVYAVNYQDPGKGNINLGIGSIVTHVNDLTAFAGAYLARGGEAVPRRVYWSRVK